MLSHTKVFQFLLGLADRVIGFSTACMIAILTNRVFQIGRRHELPILETTFTSPYINWTRAQDPHWMIDPLRHKANPRNYNSSVLESRKFFAVNTIDDFRLQDRLLRGNLNELMGSDAQTTLIAINRGKTIRMFENQNHVEQLKAMGLTPETAFGCMVNFLLKPKPDVFLPVIAQLETLGAASAVDSKVLKIGIQIRTGDHSMAQPDRKVDVSEYSAYFDCAAQIEALMMQPKEGSTTAPYTSAIWFLVSDIKSLRESAVGKYGANKVLTSTDVHIEHSSKEASVCAKQGGCAESAVSHKGFSTAVAEWWMLSMADAFVISRYSGFGRSAAMHSLRTKAIYTVMNGKERASITCNVQSATDLESISYEWSGI